MSMIRQANSPCPSCGSYYRVQGKCNKCGADCPPVDERFYASHEPMPLTKAGHANKGRKWDAKAHKYVL